MHDLDYSEQQLAGRTYRVDTYGCQMNAHESEKIAGMLERRGLTAADPGTLPEVLVLNTCCVRDSAEQRIIGHIGTLKKLKEANPDLLVCVTGCLVQQAGAAERLVRTFPFLDVVLGTDAVRKLPEALDRRLTEGGRVVWTELAGGAAPEGAMRRAEGPLAYVNVMYGCNNYCSYCIVPYVRGPERSRDVSEIVAEVQALDSAYRQVTLLGQNVNSYGGTEGETFADLLHILSAETGIERLRFMTSHPKDLTAELIEAVASEERVCKHVHLPVQAGSDAILASMNRGYTADQYLELVEEMRKAVPNLVISTDIIVGFPGETEQDFQDTLDLVDAVRFDSAFTFVYSPRQGTAAAAMPHQIDAQTKKERIVRLVARQNEITYESNAAQVGKLERVLVEGRSTRSQDTMCGCTDGGRLVNFFGEPSLRGEFVDVRVTEAKRNTLFGELNRSGSPENAV